MTPRTRSPAAVLLPLALFGAACDSGPAPSSDPADEAPVLGWRIRVLVGPVHPLVPGAGFAVRAENAAGQVFEQTAGADGIVPLGVARANGPWDITVAHAGCRAVSILGVTGDFDGDVYSECGHPSSQSWNHGHALFVGVAGAAGLTPGTTICPDGFPHGDTLGGLDVFFNYVAGGPPLDVWAVQFADLTPGARPLNVARLPPVTLLDQDMSVTIRLPTTPVATVHSRVGVSFPTEGLLTAVSVGGSVSNGTVSRIVRYNGQARTCRVGASTWTPPDAAGRGTLDVDSFVAPFDPDATDLLFAAANAPEQLTGALRLRSVADGTVVQIPPVRALHGDPVSPASMRITVDAHDYGTVYFQAHATGPEINGAWVGYTAVGAPLDGHRIPRLPSAVSLRDLTVGVDNGQGDDFFASVCVARLRAGARPPWTPAPFDADVYACVPGGFLPH